MYYVGRPLKFLVNIGSLGAVTGAAIVYLILIANFEKSIGNYFYCEFEMFDDELMIQILLSLYSSFHCYRSQQHEPQQHQHNLTLP